MVDTGKIFLTVGEQSPWAGCMGMFWSPPYWKNIKKGYIHASVRKDMIYVTEPSLEVAGHSSLSLWLQVRYHNAAGKKYLFNYSFSHCYSSLFGLEKQHLSLWCLFTFHPFTIFFQSLFLPLTKQDF